jgi:hypothetical protein
MEVLLYSAVQFIPEQFAQLWAIRRLIEIALMGRVPGVAKGEFDNERKCLELTIFCRVFFSSMATKASQSEDFNKIMKRLKLICLTLTRIESRQVGGLAVT